MYRSILIYLSICNISIYIYIHTIRTASVYPFDRPDTEDAIQKEEYGNTNNKLSTDSLPVAKAAILAKLVERITRESNRGNYYYYYHDPPHQFITQSF